jgi:DNA-binding winged helix-turn-helix (wHTH) protein/tetratricopeptide (TPR) repeat protein
MQEKRLSEFGPFGFDHEARLLLLNRELVPLSPKALDILSILIDNRGQLVTKERLIQAVWPDSFVEESNLAHHISVLRKILGKADAGQHHIETVPKRGYRFVAALNSGAAAHRRPTAPAKSAVAGERDPRRLIILPFVQLREDEESRFLCYSLPDAIGSALLGLHSLIIRSSRVATRFAGSSVDVRAIASEAAVDTVMTGTLLRSGRQVRVSTQLVEAPSGILVWSYDAQVNLDDVFTVQDELVHRIVASLAAPLTQRDRRLLQRNGPATARSYEFFLRGNDVSERLSDLNVARELYLRSLEEDRTYAPAWARLARCYRVLAKYGCDPAENMLRAQEAFDRAFILDPDLPSTHGLYAQHEAEQGRSSQALFRLLTRIAENPHHSELYAAAVQVCRYTGLTDESLKAHDVARHLDPNVSTSVMNTHFAMGNYELALSASSHGGGYMSAMALDALGRRREALECLWNCPDRSLPPMMSLVIDMLKAFLDDRRPEAVEGLRRLNHWGVDPEGFFYRARLFARLGETNEAIATLAQAVRRGFFCVPGFRVDPFLEPLRCQHAFREVLAHADRMSARAKAVLTDVGEARFLEMPAGILGVSRI